MKHKRVTNKDAARALSTGHGPPPVHPAMVSMGTVYAADRDPAANATDASDDTDDDEGGAD
jgi:hypothetical protein